MKKVRLLIIAMIAVFTMISLTACGGGKKIKLNGEVTGEIKQNGDVNITGNNGESLKVGEDLKWPKELMGSLPEIKAKITAVLKDTNSKLCTVVFADMNVEDAKKYIDKIKDLGYSNGMELSDADVLMISGTAKDSSEASFTYNTTAKEGTVTFKLQGEGKKDQSPNVTANMTDTASWPKDFIKGVPELKGKIIGVINDNSGTATVSFENVNKADFGAYIEQLKQNGYTVEADEVTSADSIEFSANNAEGDWVHAYFAITESGNNATIEMQKASN